MAKTQELHHHQITNIQEIAPNFFVIDIDYSDTFKAGQVVAISSSLTLEPRLYSIAGSFTPNTIRILFDLHKEGVLTPIMVGKRIGDTLLVSKPFGRFLGTDEAAWWIATGTGVAPFMAMLQQHVTSNKTLIHGARKINEFIFEEHFNEKLASKYVRCCSTETGNDIYAGRLTQWLKDRTELPIDIKYYLCGNPNMVVEVRDLLVSKGVPFNNIVSEIYF